MSYESLNNNMEKSQIIENNNFYMLGRHDNFWESTCEEHFFENEINLYKTKEELIENEIKNDYKKSQKLFIIYGILKKLDKKAE